MMQNALLIHLVLMYMFAPVDNILCELRGVDRTTYLQVIRSLLLWLNMHDVFNDNATLSTQPLLNIVISNK